jgi:prepilin-type N-terminal cleavage/methylation domain-containing protein
MTGRRAIRPTLGRRGFTLVELMIVVAITAILFAMAMPVAGTAIADARANTGMRAVQGHLRASRDRAIARRRVVRVTFSGTSDIISTVLDGASTISLQTSILEYGMTFQLMNGVPDTPDVLGNATAIAFGGATSIFFQPDGSLSDSTGLPLSGTVFLGSGTQRLSARAVTVLGPTGRVQGYRWDGSAWR